MNPPQVGTFLTLASAAACALIAAANAETFTLVEAHSEWNYHADGSPPDPAWRELGFDGSSWATGSAPLGFGHLEVVTEVTTVPTAYFRTRFSIDSALLDRFRYAHLRVQRNDGAVIYLNGTEIHRSNMPEGAVSHDTLAAETVASDEEKWISISGLPVSSLRPGANALAVSLHQESTTSTDSSFYLQLFADDLPPYFGSVRPGATIDFTSPFLSLSTNPYYSGILRTERPDYQGLDYLFLDDGTPVIYQGRTDPISGATLGSDALILSSGDLLLETDFVDIQDFRNVRAHIDLGAMSRELGPNSSFVEAFILLKKADGDTSEMPWFRLDALGASEFETSTVLVSEDSPIRYIVPTSADNPSRDWQQVGYDASAWMEGFLAVGYERSSSDTYDPYIKTDVEEEMYNKNQSIYLRSTFNLTAEDLAAGGETSFDVSYEDGFVAWLNGVQIASRNPPTASLSWNSGASSTHADGDAVQFVPVPIPPDIPLVEGENVLAIQAMNKGVTGSDFLIRARLGLLRRTPSINPPTFPFTRFSSEGDLADEGLGVAINIAAYAGSNPTTRPAIFLDNIHITGDPIAVHNFASYMELETPFQGSDLDASADGDRDGIANLIEYACGTDAARPDAAEPPGISFDAAGFMHVQIKIRDGAVSGDSESGYRVDDLLYVPELTKRFDQWEDGYGVPPFVQVGDITPRGDGFATVHLRSRRPLRREEQQAFFRLRVELALPPHIVPPNPDRVFVPQPTP